jgi:ATP-dependent Clp protease ATP-binding subunit ClpA
LAPTAQKNNPVLIGEPGVGKTAIVDEDLEAQRHAAQ